jgi:hypothetical protein
MDDLIAGTESQLNQLNLETVEGAPHFFNIIEMNFTELQGLAHLVLSRNLAIFILSGNCFGVEEMLSGINVVAGSYNKWSSFLAPPFREELRLQ